MSEVPTQQPTPPAKQRQLPTRKKRSQLMIAVSLVLSLCILSWTFSLPFRSNPSPYELKNQRSDLAETIRQKRTHAEKIREDAFFEHKQMVRLVNQPTRQTTKKPGTVQARKRWNNKVSKTNKRLKQLGNPEKGSVKWIEKQLLLSRIDDGPQ